MNDFRTEMARRRRLSGMRLGFGNEELQKIEDYFNCYETEAQNFTTKDKDEYALQQYRPLATLVEVRSHNRKVLYPPISEDYFQVIAQIKLEQRQKKYFDVIQSIEYMQWFGLLYRPEMCYIVSELLKEWADESGL